MSAIRKNSRQKTSREASAAARRAEWERQEPQRERDRVDAFRTLNTGFLFWTVCASKACQRAKSCDGNVDVCFDRWWPVVPAHLKIFFRAGITALRAGHPHAGAMRMANAEVARCKAMDASYAALRAMPAANSSSPLPLRERVDDPNGVRIGRERGPLE